MPTSVAEIRNEEFPYGSLMFFNEKGKHTHTRFRVWSPDHVPVLRIYGPGKQHEDYQLEDCGFSNGADHRAGWSELFLPAARAPEDARYAYGFEKNGLHFVPDFMSYGLDGGVNGKSIVTDISPSPQLKHWKGIPWHKSRFLLMHLGVHTRDGTLLSLCDELADYRDMGFNIVEPLTFGAFSGKRGWGFDTVQPVSVHESYGALQDLKTVIDDCHAHGMGFSVELIQNHFGPIGAHMEQYAGAFFTGDTPWGKAIDFAHPDVRLYFRHVARFYARLGADRFRFDAVHTIDDDESAKHILEALHEDVSAIAKVEKRPIYIVHENQYDTGFQYLGEPKGERIRARAIWADAATQATRVALAGRYLDTAYYKPYLRHGREDGEPDERNAVDAVCEVLYYGGFNIGNGAPNRAEGINRIYKHLAYDPLSAVLCIDTHDQQGNTPDGLAFESIIRGDQKNWLARLKTYVAFVLLQPSIPLMWNQFGRNLPFPFFHDMPELIEAKLQGRYKELRKAGHSAEDLIERMAPPYDSATFESARIYATDGTLRAPIAPELRSFIKDLIQYRVASIEPALDPKLGPLERPKIHTLGDKQGAHAQWNLHGLKHELALNFSDETIIMPEMDLTILPWDFRVRTENGEIKPAPEHSVKAALNVAVKPFMPQVLRPRGP